MSDPGFREIHLSGKHVVFLFMAGAVAAVAIFLLGVSVGKGITKSEVASAQTLPVANNAAADPSPSSSTEARKPNPADFIATNAMQGKDAPKPGEAPAATPAGSQTPAPSPKASATPTPTPAKPEPAKADDSKAPASGDSYFVLVDSFSSRTNANNQRAELKKKGFNANIYTVSGSKAPYRVRIGPIDKAEADAMAAKLRKEGYKPSVIR